MDALKGAHIMLRSVSLSVGRRIKFKFVSLIHPNSDRTYSRFILTIATIVDKNLKYIVGAQSLATFLTTTL